MSLSFRQNLTFRTRTHSFMIKSRGFLPLGHADSERTSIHKYFMSFLIDIIMIVIKHNSDNWKPHKTRKCIRYAQYYVECEDFEARWGT